MKKKSFIYFTLVVFGLSIIGSTILAITPSATHAINLTWEIVNTPTSLNNVIAYNSEINGLAIGSDGVTFYTIDISRGQIYKSTDGGTSWDTKITDFLRTSIPPPDLTVWNIAIAPDNPNIVAVVTNLRKQVYASSDGGANWTNLGDIGLTGNEIIADIAISPIYSGSRDIAVASRTNPSGAGTIRARKLGIGTWSPQGPGSADYTSLAFSKNYATDNGILAIGSSGDTRLNSGKRDPVANTTNWNNDIPGFPVMLDTVSMSNIIFSQIQIPSDFMRGSLDTTRIYVGYDFTDGAIRKGRVSRVENSTVQYITPPEESAISYFTNGLGSIAYYGTTGSGKLLVGTATTDPLLGQAKIWRTFNPAVTNPAWDCPLNLKQPTGGAVASPTYGFTNAKIAWSPGGLTAYCGTATAKINNASDWITGSWAGEPLDESAFSASSDGAYTWNQLALIDTAITRLSDDVIDSTGAFYLASINTSGPGFDSVWRNIGDTVAPKWVRAFCAKLSNDADINPVILRAGTGPSTSNQLALAVVGTQSIYYLLQGDQVWRNIKSSPTITDMTFSGTDALYVLNDTFVSRASYFDSVWHWREKISTGLLTGQSIAAPLKNPLSQDWVMVGDASAGKIAHADFSQKDVQFQNTDPVPDPGRMHVLCSENFNSDMIIYAACEAGKIYRLVIGDGTWGELKPTGIAFFGLTQRSGTLYSAFFATPDSAINRALDPAKTDILIQPPEWDQLVVGLISGVQFNREPNALKSSSNDGPVLWAIDNRNYDFLNDVGCLWSYADTMSTAQTTPVTPGIGDLIPMDPVTGRNAGINLAWLDIPGAVEYELWLTKDANFTLVVSRQLVTPYSQVEPAQILPAGMLEANHRYYWRVRATQADTGEFITSPWSPTLFFTIMSGLPVNTPYLSPLALSPRSGTCNLLIDNAAFSWSPFKSTDFYNFQLADNPDMAMPIVDVDVQSTAFLYSGELKYAKNYYWRVMASSPAPSEWSPVFTFSTVSPPQPAPPAVSSQSSREQLRKQVSIWLMIAIIVLINASMLIYILRRR